MSHPPASAAISAAERAVWDRIDPEALVDLLSHLVAVPSVAVDGSGAAGEGAAQRLTADWMSRAGLAVDQWVIDAQEVSRHAAHSAEFVRDDPIGVLGRLEGGKGPTILLNGHVDVVPTGHAEDWTSPPFVATRYRTSDGDRIRGRGTCDTKGGLAAQMIALGAIAAAGIDLAGTALLGPVVGEEDGGFGTLALLQRLSAEGIQPDSCLIAEPTELAVVPAAAGALSWRITVRGRSAHGCLREEGVSAIERFGVIHRAVLDLETRRNRRLAGRDGLFAWLDRPFAICGGRIAGGDWPSSECDWLTWEGRYGVAPGEELAEARSEFKQAVVAACAEDDWLTDHPAVVQWWGGQFLPGATDPAAPIVSSAIEAVSAATGRPTIVRGMPYGCDLGLTVGVGSIPTVVLGPGDIRDAHRPDESVALADLLAAARATALIVLRT